MRKLLIVIINISMSAKKTDEESEKLSRNEPKSESPSSSVSNGSRENIVKFEPLECWQFEVRNLKNWADNYCDLKVLESIFMKIRSTPMTDIKKDCFSNNMKKNRYTDVICQDNNRVILKEAEDDTESDYIHANWVDGLYHKRDYILTQGPLENTCEDFWKMVWITNAELIVMLCKCTEMNKPKCYCYWPRRGKEKLCFGQFTISWCSTKKLILRIDKKKDSYLLTEMELTRQRPEQIEETRKVKQLRYENWLDYGAPKDSAIIYSLIENVKNYRGPARAGRAPVIYHCSAGIGRSGTFLALEILTDQMKASNTGISVQKTVAILRKHRCMVVQTLAQFIFLHKCVMELAIKWNKLKWNTKYQQFFDRYDDFFGCLSFSETESRTDTTR